MRLEHQYADRETLNACLVREEPMRTWVTPTGELDLSGVDAFDRCLSEAQDHSRCVVLDLRALGFIDSAGLRSILAARLRATKRHQRLEVVCSPGQVRRMLSISGFDRLLTIIEPPAPLQMSCSQKDAA